jgi:hypothetical protein
VSVVLAHRAELGVQAFLHSPLLILLLTKQLERLARFTVAAAQAGLLLAGLALRAL